MKKVINIGLIGFNQYRHFDNIKFLFENQSDRRYRFLVVEKQSDLTIVNADSAEGQQFLSNNKTGVKVYAAASIPTENDRYFIQKPISAKGLKKILNNFLETLNADKDPNKSNQSLARATSSNHSTPQYYRPDNYLQGRILRTLDKVSEDNDCIRLTMPYSHKNLLIVITIKKRQVFITSDSNKLNKFYGFMFGATKVDAQFFKSCEHVLNGEEPVSCLSLDKLIWDSSVGASLGRLPENASETTPFKLKYWPNLTRFKIKNGFLQIAALWSQNSLSIEKVKDHLPHYSQHINSFYSAASSLGMFEKAEESVPVDSSPKVDKGFFKKLFKWARA